MTKPQRGKQSSRLEQYFYMTTNGMCMTNTYCTRTPPEPILIQKALASGVTRHGQVHPHAHQPRGQPGWRSAPCALRCPYMATAVVASFGHAARHELQHAWVRTRSGITLARRESTNRCVAGDRPAGSSRSQRFVAKLKSTKIAQYYPDSMTLVNFPRFNDKSRFCTACQSKQQTAPWPARRSSPSRASRS